MSGLVLCPYTLFSGIFVRLVRCARFFFFFLAERRFNGNRCLCAYALCGYACAVCVCVCVHLSIAIAFRRPMIYLFRCNGQFKITVFLSLSLFSALFFLLLLLLSFRVRRVIFILWP